jgi:hypothetical protein
MDLKREEAETSGKGDGVVAIGDGSKGEETLGGDWWHSEHIQLSPLQQVRTKVSKVFQKQRHLLWLILAMRIRKMRINLQMKMTRRTVVDDGI